MPHLSLRSLTKVIVTAIARKRRECLSKAGLPVSMQMRNGTAVLFREARRKDTRSLERLINEIAAEGSYFFAGRFRLSETWNRALEGDAAGAHILLVAEIDGIVGYGRVFPERPGPRSRHVGNLGLGIQKAFRRIGIGSTMLHILVREARENGYEKLTLNVFSTNSAAIQLYRAFDFKVEAQRQKQFKIGDSYVDEVLMARFL